MGVQHDKIPKSDASFFKVLLLFEQKKRDNGVGVTNQCKNMKDTLYFFYNFDTRNALFCLTQIRNQSQNLKFINIL